MDDWRETTIGDEATLQRGFDITKPNQRPGTIPVVSSGGVFSYHDTSMAKGPGVVLGRKSVWIGRSYFVESDYWPHDTTLWVKDFHGNDPRFVFYFFRSRYQQLVAMDVGSANPTLNRNHVHPIRIKWPPLPDQKAIAHILGALDDKIELNLRMNETLEAMARAIFKSWFVDFDPVRAKLEGRQPTGLSPELTALFPDSFEDSELGQIPKGWAVDPLTALATLRTDSVKPYNFPEQVWEHYSIPAFDDGRRPVLDRGDEIKSGKYAVPESCVLVSKLNPQFSRVWLPDLSGAHIPICSTEFMVFVPSNSNWRHFLYHLTKSELFQREIANRVTGSTGSRQRVRPKEIAALPILLPPPKLIDAFAQTCGSLIERELTNIREQESLATTRDTLLPRLLSGQLSTASVSGNPQ